MASSGVSGLEINTIFLLRDAEKVGEHCEQCIGEVGESVSSLVRELCGVHFHYTNSSMEMQRILLIVSLDSFILSKLLELTADHFGDHLTPQ